MTTFEVKTNDDLLAVRLPAGRYAISDPCYSARDDIYDENLFTGDHEDVFPLNFRYDNDGLYGVGAKTDVGDGMYAGSSGFSYSVDSGMIGVVSDAAVRDEARDDPNVMFHDFKNGVEVSNSNGLITIYDVTDDGSATVFEQIDTVYD